MAFLITYPQNKLGAKLTTMLAMHSNILYYPLRRIQYCIFNNDRLQKLKQSKVLVFTSHYALTAYIKFYATYNSHAQQTKKDNFRKYLKHVVFQFHLL